MTRLYEVPSVSSPTSLIEALYFYSALGFPVTPVRPGEKAGYLKGWSQQGQGAKPSEFRADDNVSLLNGSQQSPGRYHIDVDIDANSNGARLIVERLLPSTGWRYGRPSKPRSHASYLVSGQLRTRRYVGIDGKVIIELRGITLKKTFTLSVAPGSTHESGEPIRFCEPRGEIGWVEKPDDLDKAVQYAAVGIVIFGSWPANNRHKLRLAFAKILHEHGIAPDRIIAILEAVMEATKSDVDDVAQSVRNTVDAISRGQTTAGASVIVDVLGEETGQAVLKAIARILGSSAVDETTAIVMRGGQLSTIVDRAEAALLADASIYQRGGALTRVLKLDAAIGDVKDVRREAGSTILAAIREPWLLEKMGKVLPWFAVNASGKKTKADPSAIYARTLANRGEWRFPVLRGVNTAPTLARDGRIIATPGFDRGSGLLLDFEPDAFPLIPNDPTLSDAQAALVKLERPLRGFPFVDGAARSVALSALLTALIRSSLRTSPLHGFDAPTAGTGKSLLAEIAGLLATGFRPPALSQGKSEEEDEKRLSTVLFAGDPVIHIDNCERAISGEFLCSMLTQEILQARILGQSERRILPSTALVLASGNNLTFAGDTSRRAVICRLDAQVERPDTRSFDFDCHAEVLADRPELVAAGLTILRAYVVAGRPQKLTPMGSFTDWEWIRGALVWLGCADPADTRLSILDSDPRKDELVGVMDLWAKAFGDAPVEVARIGKGTGEAEVALQEKLVEVACRQGKWNAKSIGWWLRRNKDRVLGGQSFRCERGANGQQWLLAGAPPPPTAIQSKGGKRTGTSQTCCSITQ